MIIIELTEEELNQIESLVKNVDDVNFDNTVDAINLLVDQIGVDGQKHILARLIELTHALEGDVTSGPKVRLLRQVLMDACIKRANLATVLYRALLELDKDKKEKTLSLPGDQPSGVCADHVGMEVLERLGALLEPTQRIALAAALSSAPQVNRSTAELARKYAVAEIEKNELGEARYVDGILAASSAEVLSALWAGEEDDGPPLLNPEALIQDELMLILAQSECARRNGSKAVFSRLATRQHAQSLEAEDLTGPPVAAILGDLGPWATTSVTRLRAVTNDEPIEREADAAGLVALVARDESEHPVDASINNELVVSLHGGGLEAAKELAAATEGDDDDPTTWNVDVLAGVFGESVRRLSAERVAEALDAPEHKLSAQPVRGLEAYVRLTGRPFPARVLRRAWCNRREAQLPLLHTVFKQKENADEDDDEGMVEWLEGDLEGVVQQTLMLSRTGHLDAASRALEAAIATRGSKRIVAALATISEYSMLRDKLLKRLVPELPDEELAQLPAWVLVAALAEKLVVPIEAQLSAPMLVDAGLGLRVLPLLINSPFVGPRLLVALVASSNDADQLRDALAPRLALTSDGAADPDPPDDSADDDDAAKRRKAYREATLEFASRPKHVELSPELTRTALDVLLRAPSTNDADFEARLEVATANFRDEYPDFFVEPREPHAAARAYLVRYANDAMSIEQLLAVTDRWRRDDQQRGSDALMALVNLVSIEPRLELLDAATATSQNVVAGEARVLNTDSKLARGALLLARLVARECRRDKFAFAIEDALKLVADSLHFPPGAAAFRFGKAALLELEPFLEKLPAAFVADLDTIPYLAAASSKAADTVRTLVSAWRRPAHVEPAAVTAAAAASNPVSPTTKVGGGLAPPLPNAATSYPRGADPFSPSGSAPPSFLRMLGASITGGVATLAGGRLLGGSPVADDVPQLERSRQRDRADDLDAGLESKVDDDDEAAALQSAITQPQPETLPFVAAGSLLDVVHSSASTGDRLTISATGVHNDESDPDTVIGDAAANLSLSDAYASPDAAQSFSQPPETASSAASAAATTAAESAVAAAVSAAAAAAAPVSAAAAAAAAVSAAAAAAAARSSQPQQPAPQSQHQQQAQLLMPGAMPITGHLSPTMTATGTTAQSIGPMVSNPTAPSTSSLALGLSAPPFAPAGSGTAHSFRATAPSPGSTSLPPQLGSSSFSLGSARHQPFLPSAESFAPQQQIHQPSHPPLSAQSGTSTALGASAPAFTPSANVQQHAVQSGSVLHASPPALSQGTSSAQQSEQRALAMADLMPAAQDPIPTAPPSDIVLDCVHMVFNNVSPANVDGKVKDIAPILSAEHFPWFANYLVVKRISTQPNLHQLFLAFLDKLAAVDDDQVNAHHVRRNNQQTGRARMLHKAVVGAVYHNIAKLLRSNKITTSTSERSLLKNLGSWLGLITLARNRPILQRQLEVKELLFQGYETGRLIAICPFVAKILEGAKASGVFRPPNPWLMGIMGVLRELYDVEELKMNIKFEIEVLAKHLGIKIDQIEPSADGLSKRATPVKERNPDFNVKRAPQPLSDVDDGISGTKADRPGLAGQHAQLSQHMAGLHLPGIQQQRQQAHVFSASHSSAPGTAASVAQRVGVASFQPSQGLLGRESQLDTRIHQQAAAHQPPQPPSHQRNDLGLLPGSHAATVARESPGFAEQTVIPNLASYVTVSATHVSPVYAANLRRVAPVAVDRAIREIIQPVVERSVTIACITTKELVAKDFMTEPDENRMRKAAQLMVSNLAGSLALVTCKEPLRVSIAKHLRSLLTQQPPTSFAADTNEAQAIQTCAAENLDLGCMLIEKAATEKAIRDVDDALAPAFKGRQKRREQGHAFVDVLSLGGDSQSRFPAALPEQLRPKSTGLMPHQLYVYEAFARAPRHQHQQPHAQPQSAVTGQPHRSMELGHVGAGNNLSGLHQQQIVQGAAQMAQPSFSPLMSQQQQVAASTAEKEAAQRQQSTQQRQRGRGGGAAALSAAARQAAAQQPDISIAELMEAYRSATAKLDLEFASLDAQLQQQGGGKQAAEMVTFAQLRNHAIAAHVGELLLASARVERGSRDDAALAIAQSTFKAMCEPRALEPPVRLETLAIILAATADISQTLSVREEVANWIGFLPARTEAERYLHSHVLARLLGVELLDVTDLDAYLAHNVDQGRSAPWLEIALGVVEIAVARYRLAAFPNDFRRLATALDVVARSPNPPSSLRRLAATLNADHQSRLVAAKLQAHQQQSRAAPTRPDVAAPGVALQQRAAQQAPPNPIVVSPQVHLSSSVVGQQRRPVPRDPAGAREQVTALLESWIRVWNESPGSDKAYAQYLALLQQHGVPRVEASMDRFVRLAAMICVDAARRRLQQQRQQRHVEADAKGGADGSGVLEYTVIDAYAKLLVLLVKYGSASSEGQSQNTRVVLLSRVLSTLTNTLITEYETDTDSNFDQRPYFRIFLNLLQDLNVPDPVLDSSNPKVLAAFATAFHALQPAVVPPFAFSWLELVSHRMFMPNLLLAKGQKGWVLMHRLLIDLFVFLEPYLRNVQLSDAIRMLYKGTLRVLLVLLHDFPEFLSDYHFSFCDVIPSSCIQLRNLFLSAFPRSMRLPDPFTPNLKVDLLPEISQPPRILSNCVAALEACALREPLDEYLRTRHPISFLLDLPRKLRRGVSQDSYDVPLINALVVHVGATAIAQLNSKASGASAPNAQSTPMDIFQHLMNNLDSEGRYFLLNAIANQLRYPNNHTHYFSCVLLYLFAEATAEYIQEQVTRVLLERLIVHRPHPWGLLITFIELIKNPRYSFWSHRFTHCAQEIERVFESVARSCMGPGHMLNHQDGNTETQTVAS